MGGCNHTLSHVQRIRKVGETTNKKGNVQRTASNAPPPVQPAIPSPLSPGAAPPGAGIASTRTPGPTAHFRICCCHPPFNPSNRGREPPTPLSPLPRIPRNVQTPKIIPYTENIGIRDHILEGDSDRSAYHNGWWKCEHCRVGGEQRGEQVWKNDGRNFGITQKRVGLQKFAIYALANFGSQRGGIHRN